MSPAALAWTLVTAFSVLYFVNVLLRATSKYFWYDELGTLYLCRLPNSHALWAALAHGVDFNPPGFYFLTSASTSIFGEGLIAMRLPEILGFWIFSLCLFRFVSRRCGPIAGFAAMVLPSLTGAFYYAYEARPHAIVLGFGGLALVCWQMATEQPDSRWKIGFSVSFVGALVMHSYALVLAVPFAIAELFRTWERRRVDLSIWISIAAPVIAACAVNLPLMLAYRKGIGAAILPGGKDFSELMPANLSQVAHFYEFLIQPCALIIVLLVILLAIARIRGDAVWLAPGSVIPNREIVLGLALMALPLYGVALGKLVHGPFFARYFLSALGGVSILIGLGLYSKNLHRWLPAATCIVLGFTLAWQTAQLVRHRLLGWGEFLYEPSSHHLVSTGPGQPLNVYGTLIEKVRNNSAPVLVPGELDFLYLVHYAPAMKSRFFYAAENANEFFKRGFETAQQWLPLQFNPPSTFAEFIRDHAQFLVLGDIPRLTQFAELQKAGAKPVWFEANNQGQFIALMERTGAAGQ